MDAREQRGLVIAATQKLTNKGKVWIVPSQTGNGEKYTVCPDDAAPFCSCPDHETTGQPCKHIHAVRFTVRRERQTDGTVVETQEVTFTKKTTYRQDWPAYNKAQATEKDRFQLLLSELCRDIPDTDRGPRKGPKSHAARDQIFSIIYKVYCGFSARRFSTDLRHAFENGHIATNVLGMKVTLYTQNPAYTQIMTELVAKSASPLAAVETNFAVDSSGFSTSRFVRWFDEKYGCERKKAHWVKAHIACGVKTNCVTAVRVLDKDSADCPQFKPLMQETAETFEVKEASADKAYVAQECFETVADMGGTAYIPFKSNSNGSVGGLFEKMFHYFNFKRDEYLAHYHKRSNVESTFSAIKRKFGDSVRSVTDAAIANEVLAKIICHNLCCLIQEQEELGIAPVFLDRPQERSAILPFAPQRA